ncbi:MAG: hypothetical protein QGI83_04910, partial [Candidatus Latescibacteria bacterium]|nr:hypothetical protein [Candidatus Latescibacterota bacterium]
MAGYTYRQDFRWHDAAGNYDYQFGEDGYMVLDGSRQVVQCRRDLVRGITDSGGAVEFAARMTMGVPGQGDSYEIRICGGDGRPMACLHISRSDGKIRTRGPSGLVDTGAVLSFQGGRSFSDASTHKWYVVDSDEHVFRFDAFDFGAGRMRFRLDDGEPVWIPFSADGGDAARFELRTTEVGVGRRIRLRRVTQYSGREVLDAEAFPVHWRPVPAPADGMPDDNVCESLLRPVDGRWLEITTLYGFVTATVPSIPRGTVEFDLMVPDVNQEACIILGEADGTMKAFR